MSRPSEEEEHSRQCAQGPWGGGVGHSFSLTDQDGARRTWTRRRKPHVPVSQRRGCSTIISISDANSTLHLSGLAWRPGLVRIPNALLL